MSLKTFDHYEGDESQDKTSSNVKIDLLDDHDEKETEINQPYLLPQWHPIQRLSFGSVNYIVGKRSTGKHALFRFLYSLLIDQISELFVFTCQKEKYSGLTPDSHI